MLPIFQKAFANHIEPKRHQDGAPSRPLNDPAPEEKISGFFNIPSYSPKIEQCLQSHGFTTQTSQYRMYEDGSIRRAVTRMEDENPERPKLIRDREKMMSNVRLFKEIFPNVSTAPETEVSSSTPPSR